MTTFRASWLPSLTRSCRAKKDGRLHTEARHQPGQGQQGCIRTGAFNSLEKLKRQVAMLGRLLLSPPVLSPLSSQVCRKPFPKFAVARPTVEVGSFRLWPTIFR